MAAMLMTGEHAQDVLERLVAWLDADEECALVVVVETQGGAVRAPGALLAVGSEATIGYISGGCIDADVAFQARQACMDKQPRRVRYGAGSPFVDLTLPCGGAIVVQILPKPDAELIRKAHQILVGRQPLLLEVSETSGLTLRESRVEVDDSACVFQYAPKLRLRIAGRGADALALAKMSDAAGYETRVQLLDEDDIIAAQGAGLKHVQALTTASELLPSNDDPWSAFVLLFHDQDWEVPLLKQALEGSAFYIGAVGSRTTHQKRCAELQRANCSDQQIKRVRGPIGLVPSLRDASFLAISALAEIIEAFPGAETASRQNTALLMLAAGASSRFENGDKLLAELDGRPVLEHVAEQTLSPNPIRRIAVTPACNEERDRILGDQAWEIIRNPNSAEGQSTSLLCGLDAVIADSDVDQIILLLGDMPRVPSRHISQMLKLAEQNRVTAIMSECDGVLCPPALFKRKHFERLLTLEGDRGAKSIFQSLKAGSVTLKLATEHGRDIDVVADLQEASEMMHA